jgi:hypothetical protein
VEDDRAVPLKGRIEPGIRVSNPAEQMGVVPIDSETAPVWVSILTIREPDTAKTTVPRPAMIASETPSGKMVNC